MNFISLFIRRRIANRPNLINIIDNIGWLFFDKILRMGVGFIVGVWIVRYLGPEQFGKLSFASAFVGLFGAFAGLGLQGIVVRDIVRNQTNNGEILGTAAVLQFLSGLISYGLIIGIFFWLRSEDTIGKMLVVILGSIMLFKASEVVVYWFESQVLSKYTVWVKNSSFLVFAIIKIWLILNNAPLISFAWVTIGEAFVVAILLGVVFVLRGPRLYNLQFTLERAKNLLKDSWPLLLSGISILIYMHIDKIMIGHMLDDEAVGIYSVAVRISEIWYFIPMIVVASVFPSILKTKERNEEQYYRRLQLLYDVMVLISICIAVPMSFLSTPLILMVFGESFVESGSVLAIYIWAGVFVFLGVASGKWFLAENLQNLGFMRTVIGMIINILLNLILIPTYGILGAAVATIFSQAFAAYFFDLIHVKTRKTFLMKTKSLSLFGMFKR